MSKPAVVSYIARPDATPEAEIDVLANVYRFILDCHAKKEATRLGGPDDAEGRYRKNDSGAKRHCT